MTKKQKIKRIYEAAEMIETSKEEFCCLALEYQGIDTFEFEELFKYDAWNINHGSVAWAVSKSEDMPYEQYDLNVINRRVMLLLTYAHMIELGQAE